MSLPLRLPLALLLLLALPLRLPGATAATAPPEATFVIVGAGTAGSVLAGRLCTRLPTARIVLLERAPPRPPLAELLVRSPRTSLLTWQWPMVSERIQPNPDHGLQNRTALFFTGNTLGGSSATNGMQWTVPPLHSLAHWNISGFRGRTARHLFRRAASKLTVDIPPRPLRQQYASDYVNAAQRIGFKRTTASITSVASKSISQNRLVASRNGQRVDSYVAYVAPVLHTRCKSRLILIQNALVHRIVLQRVRGRLTATAVQFHGADGELQTVRATEEVLVTSGPIGSPKLLQLSGIGPRDVLQRAGIPLTLDLPVGARTHARSMVFVRAWYNGTNAVPIEPSNDARRWNSSFEVAKWAHGKKSLFGIAPSCCIGQLGSAGYFTASMTGVPGFGLGNKALYSACLPSSTSFGSLNVTRGDKPMNPPALHLNLLGEKTDVAPLWRCMRRMNAIHAEMRRDGFPMVLEFEKFPNAAALKRLPIFAPHFVGGCAVDAVVTSELKVRGVDSLRVIDASVFKSLPVSAGPMASTYALAELYANKLTKTYSKYRKGKSVAENDHV